MNMKSEEESESPGSSNDNHSRRKYVIPSRNPRIKNSSEEEYKAELCQI